MTLGGRPNLCSVYGLAIKAVYKEGLGPYVRLRLEFHHFGRRCRNIRVRKSVLR